MKSIYGVALRLFKANKFIVFSSFFSIAIAVCLIITIVTFSSNAKQTVHDEVKKLYGDMDLSIGFDVTKDKMIDADLFDYLNSLQNVKKLSRVIITSSEVDQLNGDIYTVGIENDFLAKSRYNLSLDINDDSVVMNKSLAEALNLKIGQKILIEKRPLTLIETLDDLSETGIVVDRLIISRKNAIQFMDSQNKNEIEATYVMAKFSEDEDMLKVSNSIIKHQPDLRVDIAEEDDFLKSNLYSLNIFLLVLSAIVLMVTGLLIVSNFDLLIYKNKNQLAIMRSIGATSKQVAIITFIQSSILNLTGVISGFFLAWLSQQFIHKWLEKLLSFQVINEDFNFRIAFIAMIFSLISIQLFLIIPMSKTAKILPLKIIQENEELDFKGKKNQKKIGQILIVAGILMMVFGTFFPKENIILFLSSSVLTLIGIFLIFPVYLPIVMTALLPFLHKLLGKESYIAIKNVIPQVRKNTFVILTISTLMMIAVFGSVALKTIQSNELNSLKNDFPVAIVIKSRLLNESSINYLELKATTMDLPSISGISAISTTSTAEFRKGDTTLSFNYALADLEGLEKQNLIPQQPNNIENTMIISAEFAKRNELKVGSKIDIGLYSVVEQKSVLKQTAVISGIMDNIKYGDAYLDWDNQEFHSEFTAFSQMYITSPNQEKALSELETLKRKYPEIRIHSYEESLKESLKMFYQRWSIYILVLTAMVILVMAGVFNTLVNNIYSKRKEFAVLRAMGIPSHGISKIIITQVITYLIIGLLIGAFAGIVLAFSVSRIDPTPLAINYTVIFTVGISMLIMSCIIFIPFSKKISKQNVSEELSRDNK